MTDILIVDCEQGSKEWHAARLAIPTCSMFDNIITNETMKPSKSSGKYMARLLHEYFKKQPWEDSTAHGYMERGQVNETSAVKFYQMQRDVDTTKVGFILRADRRVGGSPDRLIGDDGILEIKCPSAPVHIQYALGDEGIGYQAQCQGLLWLTGRQYVDTISYHPEYPSEIVRVERDEKFLKALDVALRVFLERFEEAKRFLTRKGYVAEEVAAILEPEAPIDAWLQQAGD